MTKIPPTSTLTKLFDALGVGRDEHVSLNHKIGGGKLRCEIITPADADAKLADLPAGADVYWGINPVILALGANGQRGTAQQVVRVVALPIDLDVKPGGCGDFDTAWAIIGKISDVLGTRPVAIILSGHGLQAIWAVKECGRLDGTVLLRRFRWLAEAIAAEHGAAIDNVFDLPRILRVPGTTNHKRDPVEVTVTWEPDARALAVAGIMARLTEAGISRVRRRHRHRRAAQEQPGRLARLRPLRLHAGDARRTGRRRRPAAR